MSKHPIRFILTDIEGTTTSISFVADELFPYFRNNIDLLKTMTDHPVVKEAFAETIELALKEDGKTIATTEEIIETLRGWSVEDRKITPLKTLQGLLWKKGYEDGDLKGHVYADVPSKLNEWHAAGIGLGVFSSGSVAAQKLIFGYSIAGDLTPNFSAYFDTKTGGKRETETYRTIAEQLQIPSSEILFLSDIVAELEAANEAGYQTVQLLRPGTEKGWNTTAADFSGILVS
jgi:enolase-phosphatase E1